MRLKIISGTLGGRFIQAPSGHVTHPMSERARGGMFNSLGNLTGKTLLDPYAGSGAVSFEAISRGAEFAIMIERDRRAQETILRNIESLDVADKVKLIKADCRAWSRRNEDQTFDIIVLEQPYGAIDLSTAGLLVKHLKSTGIMILSHPGRESSLTVNGVVVVDKMRYGDAALAFYRKEPSKI
ncbi:MAG TPA: RsmD family RNA methyltransferase [Candidatus Saccharimonadales bacterium]|nr:RsmD family RNA methyltransferase [Candidatus Saccharimonadales bacterium]